MTKELKIIYTASAMIEGFFEIPGVNYRGKIGTYRIFEKMTSAMNHDKLVEYSVREKEKGNPSVSDSILTFAFPLRAYELRKNHPKEIEMFRKFFHESLKQYPNTSTRVAYLPLENDKIIHNYGIPDKYILEEKVIGTDGWIKDIPDKKILKSLLGTNDIKKINEISQWINGTNCYLWRLNSKPPQKNERVVGFDADPDRLYLDCYRDSADWYPAFRVLKVD